MQRTAHRTFFTRRFPNLPRLEPAALDEAGLVELGNAMRAPEIRRADPNLANPKAGYTYLGQFIDHDLTFDETPLAAAGKREPCATPNLRSPRLDLDHLYGDGPELAPYLYARSAPRSSARFLVGQTLPSIVEGTSFAASANDLPRNSEGIALLADRRQDENLIIAQLHVAFLKLHNRIISDAAQLASSPHYHDAGSEFAAARRVLTWHYQWVVRHDFLRQVLDECVFCELPAADDLRAGRAEQFRVPVEFSVAAFRFGHTMVRDDYFFNNTHPHARLAEDLFRMTGYGGGAVPALPADWVIDWQRFFFMGGGDSTARHGSPLDTLLARALHQLPPEHRAAPIRAAATIHESPLLAVRTLKRGERVGLPSGQAVACALELQPLSREQIAGGSDGDVLRKYGYDSATPLWYYILKEAEIIGRRERLGPVGSRLVGDVILDALAADPESYLTLASGWRPTIPGPKAPELFGMADLLRYLQR